MVIDHVICFPRTWNKFVILITKGVKLSVFVRFLIILPVSSVIYFIYSFKLLGYMKLANWSLIILEIDVSRCNSTSNIAIFNFILSGVHIILAHHKCVGSCMIIIHGFIIG